MLAKINQQGGVREIEQKRADTRLRSRFITQLPNREDTFWCTYAVLIIQIREVSNVEPCAYNN